MVMKKDRPTSRQRQGTGNTFEKLFFIILAALSALFLLITGWFLLTGDELIFLHGFKLAPQHFCLLLYLQSFFNKKLTEPDNNSHSTPDQIVWQF